MYSYQVDAPAEEYEDEEEYEVKKQGQLSCWGNQQSMNLNPLILTNITMHRHITQVYFISCRLE